MTAILMVKNVAGSELFDVAGQSGRGVAESGTRHEMRQLGIRLVATPAADRDVDSMMLEGDCRTYVLVACVSASSIALEPILPKPSPLRDLLR